MRNNHSGWGVFVVFSKCEA